MSDAREAAVPVVHCDREQPRGAAVYFQEQPYITGVTTSSSMLRPREVSSKPAYTA